MLQLRDENKLCVRLAPEQRASGAELRRGRRLGVRQAQAEEAAKKQALQQYGTRVPPGASRVYEAEAVRPPRGPPRAPGPRSLSLAPRSAPPRW